MTRSETPLLLALLFGNFVIGVGVLMPAGLLNELSQAFSKDAATVGSLIGYGGAVLCIEAPLLAFFTNKIDRRTLLTLALAVYAIGHLVSAFAPNFEVLLVARLLMIGGAAVFTPQAASAVGLVVAPERRARAVIVVFLGWSFASAVGVPLASLIGAYAGWSSTYSILAIGCAIAALGVFASLPGNLHAPMLSVSAWRNVLTSGRILTILSITAIFIAGQFSVYPYLAAELKFKLNATPELISSLFAVYGLSGLLGSAVSAAAISRLSAPKTVSISLALVVVGLALWSASAGSTLIAVAALIAWGYGGGPAISGQQARLIMADPAAASASVALNTSVLYAGQAFGTYAGGQLLNTGHEAMIGFLGVSLGVVALLISLSVQRWLRA